MSQKLVFEKNDNIDKNWTKIKIANNAAKNALDIFFSDSLSYLAKNIYDKKCQLVSQPWTPSSRLSFLHWKNNQPIYGYESQPRLTTV